MKRYYKWFALLLFVLVASFTNPDEEAHKTTVKQELTTIVNVWLNDKSNTYMSNPFSRSIAEVMAQKMVDNVAQKMVVRKNFILFSLTEIHIEDEVRYIGIGGFNSIYITPEIKNRMLKLMKVRQ